MNENDIVRFISGDSEMMLILEETAEVFNNQHVLNWCVYAGFLRDKIWNHINDIEATSRSPSTDIDIAFYSEGDQNDVQHIQKILAEKLPQYAWDVSNYAHPDNNEDKSSNLYDGLSKNIDTISTIGMYLDPDKSVNIIAPYGINDLVNCIIRPTAHAVERGRKQQLISRINSKKFFDKWENLKVII